MNDIDFRFHGTVDICSLIFALKTAKSRAVLSYLFMVAVEHKNRNQQISQGLNNTCPTITTRLKKKAAPYFEWKDKKNQWFEHFFVEVIWKIFKFSFILDQSQICISNGLGARACQSYLLICKNAHFSMGLQNWKCQCFHFFFMLFLNE